MLMNRTNKNRFYQIGFITMFIMTVGMMLFQFMRPVNGASTGTCLPLSKGGTSCDSAATVAYVKTDLINTLYPVGTVLTTTTSANPGTIYGVGTWTAFGQGRTLLGIGSNAANTNTTYGSMAAGVINRTTPEELGGESTHQLTIAEMPSHNHQQTLGGPVSTVANVPGGYVVGASNTSLTTNTGGDQPHNNIQPYVTVYFWKRTN